MRFSRVISVLESILFGVVALMLFVLIMPSSSPAQEGNLICSEPGMCPYPTYCDPPTNKIKGVVGKPCWEIENGRKTPGACFAPGICEATGTSEGKSPMDPSKLLEALKGLMDLLKKKDKGDDKPPPTNDPCLQPQRLTAVNLPNSSTSPPCVGGGPVPLFSDQLRGLNGSTGGATNIADALLKALGGSVSSKLTEKDPKKGDDEDTGVDEEVTDEDYFDEITDEEDGGGIGDDLINLPEDSDDGSGSNEGGGGNTEDGSKGDQKTLLPSLVGDIFVGDSGATIFARSRDPGSNTEVAGFYGGGAFNAQASKSLVGRMCASRPWSGGFLASVIPTSFFDGLCRRAGYQVGQATSTPAMSGSGASVKKVAPPKKDTPKTKAAPMPAIYPEVDIWAEPPTVRLGTRTYIFWTSKDVVSCQATGPSFFQGSLSGGASTVPLSEATTFKIICLTVASTTVEDSVTVRLAL